MKQSMVLLAAIAGAATAQNLGSCAQLCINNMNLIANTQFSCPAGDQACFCSQSNWAYGVRDCSQQACDAGQAAQAISYAQSQCQQVQSTLASGATASPSAALSILNPAAASASAATGTASGESATATGSGSQSAITTVPLVATVTNSDGSVQTTTSGFSTVYSSGALTESAASAASSAASSVASELSSALSSAAGSASSALASLTGSAASAASSAASAAGSAASSAASAAGSAASSAVPSGAAAKVTGLPVAAGLGLAAYFFI